MGDIKRQKGKVVYQLEKIKEKMENIVSVVEKNYDETGEGIVQGYPFEMSANDFAYELGIWIEKINKEVK